jgi:hypothetical protein
MPSSQGEFATCLTMSINRGELRALELRRSSTRKFDGGFDQGTQSHVGAARVRYMLVICNGSMSAVGKWNWGSYRAFPLGPDIRIPQRPPCYPDKLGRSPTPVCARFLFVTIVCGARRSLLFRPIMQKVSYAPWGFSRSVHSGPFVNRGACQDQPLGFFERSSPRSAACLARSRHCCASSLNCRLTSMFGSASAVRSQCSAIFL